jgi:hypothetical protein
MNLGYISQREAGDGDPQQCLRKITPVGERTGHKDFNGHQNTPIKVLFRKCLMTKAVAQAGSICLEGVQSNQLVDVIKLWLENYR